MGGSSSSRGSTSSSTDKSVNLNAGGYVAQNGSSITITDGGAVENALEFGKGVASDAFDFGGMAIDSNENITEDSLQFAEKSLNSIASSNALTVNTLSELAQNLKANETSGAFEVDKALIYGVLALIVLTIIILVMKGKK